MRADAPVGLQPVRLPDVRHALVRAAIAEGEGEAEAEQLRAVAQHPVDGDARAGLAVADLDAWTQFNDLEALFRSIMGR